MKSPLFVVMMLLCIFVGISSLYAQDAIWVKGCTHAHTKNSDGNLPPEDVANWYKTHGYNFLFITDHNFLTEPDSLKHLVTANYILIGGEELGTGVGSRPVHANALGITRKLNSPSAPNVPEAIQALTDTITEAGGMVQINHPNWHWGIDYRDLLQAEGYELMEIANLGCSDAGDDAHISSEQIWDQILTRGKKVWGMATDDAHNYTSADAKDSFPGAGWIMVKVNALTAENVLAAMKKGDFYSTRGPLFETLTFINNLLHVKVVPEADRKYRIMAIGENGQILNDFDGTEIMVNLDEPGAYDGYVRIKVIDNTGKVAWTQPVWPQK